MVSPPNRAYRRDANHVYADQIDQTAPPVPGMKHPLSPIRSRKLRLPSVFLSIVLPALYIGQPVQAAEPFEAWLQDLKAEAMQQGISPGTLDTAFKDVAPIEKVLEYDRKQPEFSQTFWTYLNRAVSTERINRGKMLLQKHAALLSEVEAKYGVQPRFLVAFWGLETNYGDYTGGFPVISALATLAHDERRADFFRAELFNALQILDQGHIAPDKMSGSWAGAMGQTQFMPSTFTGYATDGDGDGKIDIWGSLPDVFHSAAHYLASVGWKGDETWGREVKLPPGFDLDLTQLTIKKHISEWQALGVRRANGADLPQADIEGSVILPAGAKGPAFLVYQNFRSTLVWNRSILYAAAVGYLADRFVDRGHLVATQPPGDKPLSRADVITLQTNLSRLGFDVGEPDGVAGSMTRKGLRAYQRSRGLPPDGHPSSEMVEILAADQG